MLEGKFATVIGFSRISTSGRQRPHNVNGPLKGGYAQCRTTVNFATGIADGSSSVDENIRTLHQAVLGGTNQVRTSILVSRGLANVSSGSG